MRLLHLLLLLVDVLLLENKTEDINSEIERLNLNWNWRERLKN